MKTNNGEQVTGVSHLDTLWVKGARAHNLKNVEIALPRDSMVVFTGLSGSGKSSLAFDTIFAEDSVATSNPCPPMPGCSSGDGQARCRLHQGPVAGGVDRPKSTSRNPRSTVGTITEVYDFLRLLWARIGIPHCPVCGEVITKQTRSRSSTSCSNSRSARSSSSSLPSSAPARADSSTSSPTCSRRASPEPSSTASRSV